MSKTNSKRRQRLIAKPQSKFPAVTETPKEKKASEIDVEAVWRLRDDARVILGAPEAEKIAEITKKLASAPKPVAVEAIHVIGHDLGEQALPLLDALIKSGEHELSLAAVQALGAIKSTKAAEVLEDLTVKSSDREIAKEARRSLFKLKTSGIRVERPSPPRPETMAVEHRTVTLFKAYMTNPDGDGNQVFEAAAEGPFGRVDAFSLFLNDREGIKDFRAGDSGKKAWEKMVRKLDEITGISVVEIPVDYFRYRAKQAYELSIAQGTTVKSSFYRWRDLLTETEKTYERHPIYDEISIVEIKWNPELLEQSPQILDNEEFFSWLLPIDEVKGYVEELYAVLEGKVALPSWVEEDREKSIAMRAMDHFFGPEARSRYKSRLEDTAYVLFHSNRQLDAKRALAAALAFDEQTGIPSFKHPFALALFQETVVAFTEEQFKSGIAEQKRLVTDISQLAQYIDFEKDLK